MRDTDSIVGLRVVSVAEGKQLGVVNAVVCDLAQGRMLGLIVSGEPETAVWADDIATIGPQVVMVSSASVARPLEEAPELQARRGEPGQRPPEVITSDGRLLGVLARIHIDPASRAVTRFCVSGGLWRDMTEGVLTLPQMPGIVHGADVIIVPADAEALTTGGIRDQLERVGGVVGGAVRAGYHQFAERTEEILSATREAARSQPAASATSAPEATPTASDEPLEQDSAEEEPPEQEAPEADAAEPCAVGEPCQSPCDATEDKPAGDAATPSSA